MSGAQNTAITETGDADAFRLAEGVVFTLYSREYCHLCHDMLGQLNAIRGIRAFEVVVIDVDSDPRLEERFGEWVPVLFHDEREVARYHLNVPELEAYLVRLEARMDEDTRNSY